MAVYNIDVWSRVWFNRGGKVNYDRASEVSGLV